MAEIVWTAERLLEHGHHRAVVALCTRALVDHGDRADVRICRARGLMAARRTAEAARDLALALRADPRSAAAHRLLCEIALCRGDLHAAQGFLEHALRLDPIHPRVWELADVVLGWRAERAARAARAARDQLRGPRRAA